MNKQQTHNTDYTDEQTKQTHNTDVTYEQATNTLDRLHRWSIQT